MTSLLRRTRAGSNIVFAENDAFILAVDQVGVKGTEFREQTGGNPEADNDVLAEFPLEDLAPAFFNVFFQRDQKTVRDDHPDLGQAANFPRPRLLEDEFGRLPIRMGQPARAQLDPAEVAGHHDQGVGHVLPFQDLKNGRTGRPLGFAIVVVAGLLALHPDPVGPTVMIGVAIRFPDVLDSVQGRGRRCAPEAPADEFRALDLERDLGFAGQAVHEG